MPATQPSYAHITFKDGPFGDEVPHIDGTRMKVIHLVRAKRAHGWSPEEMKFQYPHLSLAQIHAALAYYYDHQEALDADIERRDQRVDRLRQETTPSTFVKPDEALR